MGIVKRISVKDQVYRELKARILNDAYPPGERINIDNIARELSVSNSPVREAVNMLVKDGLLLNSINSGPRVITLDNTDVEELNQAIYVLLVSGYDICRRTDKAEALLAELQDRIQVQKVLLGENKHFDYIKAAIHFDRAFLDVTDNSRLIAMYDSLADVFHLSVTERYRKNLIDHKDNMEDHQRIITAIKDKNDDELRHLLALHYKQA